VPEALRIRYGWISIFFFAILTINHMIFIIYETIKVFIEEYKKRFQKNKISPSV
jgi:hypothetical protein